jgi:hypothetical protein
MIIISLMLQLIQNIASWRTTVAAVFATPNVVETLSEFVHTFWRVSDDANMPHDMANLCISILTLLTSENRRCQVSWAFRTHAVCLYSATHLISFHIF